MSIKFWKIMDQFFLIVIEVTGEKEILQENIPQSFTSIKIDKLKE